MKRIQMSMTAVTAVLSNMFAGVSAGNDVTTKGARKRNTYSGNGTAFTRGKRHASLKSRANRRK